MTEPNISFPSLYNWHAANGELKGIHDSEHWHWTVRISPNTPRKNKIDL